MEDCIVSKETHAHTQEKNTKKEEKVKIIIYWEKRNRQTGIHTNKRINKQTNRNRERQM